MQLTESENFTSRDAGCLAQRIAGCAAHEESRGKGLAANSSLVALECVVTLWGPPVMHFRLQRAGPVCCA